MADITKINLKGTVLDIKDAGAARQADLPTKVSDLTNDSGFITASEVSGIVAGSGDIVISETSGYIDIFIYGAEIGISPNMLSLYAAQKSAVIKVSGTHLKNDISISVPTGFTASPSTISHVNGTVADTNVTITYTGADASAASGSITATAGDATNSIPVTYSQYQGPTIIADSSLTINSAAGSNNTGTLAVQGINLTAGITAVISGTNAAKFSVSPASISQSGGMASGTLTITYSPAAGDSGTHTATLTLSSSSATSKVITLNGAVSTLTISKQSMSFNTDQGVAVTDTFTVEGSNLNSDITIAASGTGFSVSPNTIAQSGGTVASTTVTVTYQPSAAGTNTGTITIQSSGATKTITLSGTAAEATTSDAEGKFSKKDANGNTIYYKRQSADGEFTNNVTVYNPEYKTSGAATTKYSGAIVIPATVACDGTTYNVKSLAAYSFAYCTGMTSLTLPEGLTYIGLNAIRDCTNNSFTSLVIPDSVTTMENNNLYNCSKLTSVKFGEGLTVLGQYIAPGKAGMSSVILGSNIASIGNYSEFKMADNGVVTCLCAPFYVDGVKFKTASGSYPCNATLRVPASLVNSYKGYASWGRDNTSNWHMFNPDNIVAIDE